MRLPGGYYREDGKIMGSGRFRALNGHRERTVWEAIHGRPSSRPVSISRIIDALFEAEDGKDWSADQLSVGDRQFLLARLAARFDGGPFWLNSECVECGEHFDLCIDPGELPVKPPGAGYPFAFAKVGGRKLKVRAPTGVDQQAIAELEDEAEAITLLAKRCIIDPPPFTDGDETLGAIETAMQAVSPEVAATATSQCPKCGTENETPIDVFGLLVSRMRDPLEEVHSIAFAYHWSENDILSLPRARRHAYLALIDRENEVHQ